MIAAQTGFAHASANDFVIRDFQADYYLDKDSEGRSVLKTVENITAEFPAFDQNHGIERVLLKSYDGHSVSLKVQSVKDQYGNDINYSTHGGEADNLILRIGNADTYVHGLNTYVITYNQRDVTKFFSNTNDDEFYWDTNGTGWLQPFDKLTVRLHIGSNLENNLTGNQSCYYGLSGSNKQCDINKDKNVFTASATGLSAGENLTIAVGFSPHTFSEYTKTLYDYIQQYVCIVSMIFSVIILAVILFLRFTKGKSAPGRGTIIAEYLPPKGIDVPLSSVIMNQTKTWIAATYIDLAVRHRIKIIESEKKVWWKKQKSYALELISPEGLSDTENDIVGALFGSSMKVGDQYKIDSANPDAQFIAKIRDAYEKVKKTAKKEGYYIINNKLKFAMIGLSVFAVLQSVAMLIIFDETKTLFIGESVILNIITIIFIISITSTMKPLSQKGRELFDYLKGLEQYIKIAEEDRIKVLQSPKGAERTPVNTNDKAEMLHLYERVLPYAILFGNEKEWTKVLGKFYEQQGTGPDWYAGNGAFNVLVFTSALSSFSSSAVASSYASSSGGSSGGGFSGGGGGGGGGGGW